MTKKTITKKRMITMFDRKELKDRAKLVLLRSYSKVFWACILVSLLSGSGIGLFSRRSKNTDISLLSQQKQMLVLIIFLTLAVLTILLSIFMVAPLMVGHKKFMIENSKSNAPLNLLFLPFNDGYWHIVFVQFMKELFIFLWALPALLPTAVLIFQYRIVFGMIYAAANGLITAQRAFLGLSFLWSFSTLILYIPALIKGLQYILVPYILADNPEMSWRDALSESKEMMVGNKLAYIKLILSFIPWWIAANFLCLIGGFLVTPYFEATICEMYIELSGQAHAENVFYV